MLGSERPTSLKIVIMEPIEKRRPDAKTGIQNVFPVFRCLMVLRVPTPSIDRRAAIKANVLFEIRINQFIVFPQVFLIKIYDMKSTI